MNVLIMKFSAAGFHHNPESAGYRADKHERKLHINAREAILRESPKGKPV